MKKVVVGQDRKTGIIKYVRTMDSYKEFDKTEEEVVTAVECSDPNSELVYSIKEMNDDIYELFKFTLDEGKEYKSQKDISDIDAQIAGLIDILDNLSYYILEFRDGFEKAEKALNKLLDVNH